MILVTGGSGLIGRRVVARLVDGGHKGRVLVRCSPVVPVAGDGRARFQPIWVEDLVTCIVARLYEDSHNGEVLEVGGPGHLGYDEMPDIMKEAPGRSRVKLHVPLALMRPVAQMMEWVLPRPPVTTEKLNMLSLDNVSESDAVTKSFGAQSRRLADSLDHVKRR